MSNSFQKVFYFGPLKVVGHHLFESERGWILFENNVPVDFHSAWRNGSGIDGCLQPGCGMNGRGQWERDYGAQIEGEALMHYVDGWTAMSFWDRTIDKRSGCNSTFIARGRFVFDELLAMAKAQYPKRFSLMKFKIVEVKK